MKYRQYISYSLLAISGIFLLCTVFATDTGLANGLVTGKVLWFHLAMLLLAACSLVFGRRRIGADFGGYCCTYL